MTDAEHAELQAYREEHLRRFRREIFDHLARSGYYRNLDHVMFSAAFCGRSIPELDAMQHVKLSSLATLANCWWHWPEGADQEQKISLDEARRLYGE